VSGSGTTKATKNTRRLGRFGPEFRGFVDMAGTSSGAFVVFVAFVVQSVMS